MAIIQTMLSKAEKATLTETFENSKRFIKAVLNESKSSTVNSTTIVISVNKENGTAMPYVRITPTSSPNPSSLRKFIQDAAATLNACGLPWSAQAEEKYLLIKVEPSAYAVFIKKFEEKNKERMEAKKTSVTNPLTAEKQDVIPNDNDVVVKSSDELSSTNQKPQSVEWVKYEVLHFLYSKGFTSGASYISIVENRNGGLTINCSSESVALSINATFTSHGFGSYSTVSKRGGKNTKVVLLNLPATFVSPLPHSANNYIRVPRVARYTKPFTEGAEKLAENLGSEKNTEQTPPIVTPELPLDIQSSLQQLPGLVEKIVDALDNKCLAMKSGFLKKMEESITGIIGDGNVVEVLVRVSRPDGKEEVVIITKERWSELFV